MAKIILILDDDRNAFDIMALYFSYIGDTIVQWFKTGESVIMAMQKIREKHCDPSEYFSLFFFDLGHNDGMGGTETLRFLKRNKFSLPPVIAMSDDPTHSAMRNPENFDFADIVLEKPFSREQLKDTIEGVLKEKAEA